MRWPRAGYPKVDTTGSASTHTSRVMSCQASLSLSKMAFILAVIESIAFDRRRDKTKFYHEGDGSSTLLTGGGVTDSGMVAHQSVGIQLSPKVLYAGFLIKRDPL